MSSFGFLMASNNLNNLSPEHNILARRYLALMKTITLTAENEKENELVLHLAQRLGLEYHEETLVLPAVSPAPLPNLSHRSREELLTIIDERVATPPVRPLPDVSHLTREEMLAIIRRGGDGKSIPDPLAWQREERDWDARLAFPKP